MRRASMTPAQRIHRRIERLAKKHATMRGRRAPDEGDWSWARRHIEPHLLRAAGRLDRLAGVSRRSRRRLRSLVA